MTLSYTKDNKDIKLKDDQAKALKDKIVAEYTEYYQDLSPHISDYELLKKHVFGILRNKKSEEYLSSKIYELRETYRGQLKNRCASSLETMFGLEGNTEQDHKNAAIMKAYVEDKLEKMDFLALYDDGISNYIDKGGFYTFVEWVTELKEVKRIVDTDILTGLEATQETLPENIKKGRITKTETIYNGAKASIIDTFTIVYNRNRIYEWDKCEKIIKTWITPEAILATQEWNLSPETKEALEKVSKSTATASKSDDSKIAQEAINGNMVEVLTTWGDLRLKDGTYLQNWHTVTIARLEVVRFCKNPYLINPITRCVFMIDPETKREISPLLVGVVENIEKSDIFKDIKKALKFSINPAHLTKGNVKIQGEVEVKPGSYTKLLDDGESDTAIVYSIDGKGVPLNMEVIPSFDANIEASTGINKYLTGNVEGSKVDFATEAQGIMGGGEVRINKDVENINRNLTKDTIQKIADLHSNMAEKPEQIKTREGGKISFAEVTPEVIQGSYEFKISDAKQNSLNEKEAQLTVNVLEKCVQIPNFKAEEAAKYALESICKMKDTSRFFEEDELNKAITAIPEQQREQAKQHLIEVLHNPQAGQQQPAPTPNQFVMDITSKTICDDNRYPDNVKQGMLNMLGLQATQDYIKKLEVKNAPKSNPNPQYIS